MAEGKKKGLALHWQILIGIGLGIVAGIVLCKITPYDNWYKYIKWAGDIFLRGLRMIVIPLVFSSIALGVAGMGNSAALGRIAGKTILYYIVTTAIAATIGLTLVNIVKPGVGANLNLAEEVTAVGSGQVSFIDQIVSIVPSNIFESMAKGDLLPIIFFAIIFGLFMNKVDEKYTGFLTNLFTSIYEVIMKITMFIIRLAPYGVFAIVTNVVGKQADGADMKAGGVYSAELDFEDVIEYPSVTAAEKAEYSIADENGVTIMCALMTEYEAFEDGGLITFELDGNIISVDSVKDERFLHFVGKFVSVRLRNAVVWPYDMP